LYLNKHYISPFNKPSSKEEMHKTNTAYNGTSTKLKNVFIGKVLSSQEHRIKLVIGLASCPVK
jgi:hypothetical protein